MVEVRFKSGRIVQALSSVMQISQDIGGQTVDWFGLSLVEGGDVLIRLSEVESFVEVADDGDDDDCAAIPVP